jgi:Neuraminidase (sialidase)
MKPILVLSVFLFLPVAISPARAASAANQNAKVVSPHGQGNVSNRNIAPQPLSGRDDVLTCSPAPCVLPNVLITASQSYNTILAANPVNHAQLLAGVDVDYGGNCPFGSVSGGATWYQNQTDRCAGDTPSIAYGKKNTAYQVGANYETGIYFTATTDNGNTWSTATEAVPQLFSYGSVSTPWLGVDNSAKSSYANSLYIAATQQGEINDDDIYSEITVSYSRDGGNTWTMEIIDPVQVEPEVDYYSRLAVASDGTVYVTWQRCEMTGKHVNCGGTKAHMWLSKSTDGGNTWSSPTEIAVVTLVPDSCDCAFYGNLPHTTDPVANPPLIAVDNSSGPNAGSLYAVVYNWTGKQMQVEVFASRDEGVTWQKPVRVAPSYTNDEFFPGLSVSASGFVGVNWLDRRNDPQNIFYQPFTAVSYNGSKSFGQNYRLAKPLSNPYYSSYSMGDYTGNAWAGKTLFVTWPDTRNAIMQDYVGGLVTK